MQLPHSLRSLAAGLALIGAPTALRFGLVNELVPAAELETRTAALAQKLAGKSPVTLAIGKEAFYRQAELPLSEAYAYTKDVMEEPGDPGCPERHRRLHRQAGTGVVRALRGSTDQQIPPV